MIKVSAALLGAVCGSSLAQPPFRYDGQMGLRVHPRDERQAQTARSLAAEVLSCEIPRVGPFDIRMSRERLGELDLAGIRYSVQIPDLQAYLDDLRAQEAAARAQDDGSWFNTYRSLAEIEGRMAYFATTYPHLATLSDVGTSVQGRAIKMLRITGPGSTQDRPAILLQANQHAREWVTPLAALYIIDRLCETYVIDPRTHDLVDRIDFYVIASVNPDGYEYSRNVQASWRKNRRDNPGTTCDGVDLNRNWGYQWGFDNTGSSPDPCSDTYRGPAAWSEPEITGIKSFADSLASQGRLRVWWDIHANFGMLASPWQYTATGAPPGLPLLNQLGLQSQTAIRAVRGTTYEFGQCGIIMYLINGGHTDYAYAVDHALAWTVEVEGSSFMPPVSQILPLCREAYAGLLPIAQHVAPPPCYANCDQSTTAPILNVQDFNCFLGLFAFGGFPANCDGSTTPPILNIQDFGCFLNAFAAGCS